MRKLAFFIVFLLATFLFSNCHSQKKVGSENCTTQGEVKDFSMLDGCGLLLVTPDGKKLAVVNWDQWESVLKVDTKIKFGYKEVEPRMSICMSEDAYIEITCVEAQ